MSKFVQFTETGTDDGVRHVSADHVISVGSQTWRIDANNETVYDSPSQDHRYCAPITEKTFTVIVCSKPVSPIYTSETVEQVLAKLDEANNNSKQWY